MMMPVRCYYTTNVFTSGSRRRTLPTAWRTLTNISTFPLREAYNRFVGLPIGYFDSLLASEFSQLISE